MNRLKYTLMFLLTLTGFSCSEYLERFPLDNPSDETFLRNEAEFDLAVTGAYNSLWFKAIDNGPFMLTLECATDLGWDRNGSDLQVLGKGIATTDNTYTKAYWDTFYRGIGRCNYIISKSADLASVVPADKYNRSLAEVRFLRAYYYFMLNELFGGVPLLTKPTSLADSKVARSTKTEVNDFIISELEAIKAAMPPKVDQASRGKASRGAALALLSRAALFNQRWDKAAQAAKELMDLNAYSLAADFSTLFAYAGQNSPEIIFAAQFLKGTSVHSTARHFYSRIALGHSNKIPVQVLVDSYECTDGLAIDKSPLYDPKKPFANRDPRLNATVVLPQTRFINYMFETHPDSLMTWDYTGSTPRRIANVEATHAYATFSGYLWRKYADVADFGNIDQSDLNITLFRYAEVLLNYVEAKVELNQIDQSVYDAINAVRGRASVKMPPITSGKSQADLRNAVRRERKYELAGEGLRLFDIRRWDIAKDVMTGNLLGRVQKAFLASAPRIDEMATPTYQNVANASQMRVIETRLFDNTRDKLWPVPRIETETNTALEQNPKY